MRLGLGLAITGAQGAGGVNGLDLNFAGGRYALNSPYSSALPASFSFTRAAPDAYGLIDGEWTAFGTDEPVIIPGKGMQVYASYENKLSHSERPDDSRYWSGGGGFAFDADGEWNGTGYFYAPGTTPAGLSTASIDIYPGTATAVAVHLWEDGSTPSGWLTVDLTDGSFTPSGVGFAGLIEPLNDRWRVHVTTTFADTDTRLIFIGNANGTLTPRRAQINAGGPKPYQPSAPAATNLLLRSEEPNTPGTWNTNETPVFDGQAFTAAIYGQGVYQFATGLTLGDIYTWQCEVEVIEGAGHLFLGIEAGNRHLTFDIETGEVIALGAGLLAGDVRTAGPGKWLAWGRFDAPSTSIFFVYGADSTSKKISFKGQVEAGPVATDYIATAGSQVTRAALNPVRAADVADADYTPAWPLTGFADFVFSGEDGRVVTLHNPDTGPYGNMVMLATQPTGVVLVVRSGNVEVASLTVSGLTRGQRVRAAFVVGLNDARLCVNGGAVQSDATVTVPEGISKTRIGRHVDDVYLNSTLGQWLLWRGEDRENAELQAMTEEPA